MNALEGSSPYELDRPVDIDFSKSDAVAQLNQRDYFLWLRACLEFDPDRFKLEAKKYEDLFEAMGRGDYLGVCEHCGK